jgi:hypothetical protein
LTVSGQRIDAPAKLIIDFGKMAEDLKSLVTMGKFEQGGLDITSAGMGWAAILSQGGSSGC